MPYQQVNGIQLYYELSGQGTPLLFLHGLGSSTQDWELQCPFFASHYQVLAVDTRGHGRSGKPPGPYSVPQFAADVAALVRRLEMPALHVVGLSMGGMIGFQLALDTPELVRTLTIVNSGPSIMPKTWRDWLSVGQRLLLFKLFNMGKIGAVIGGRIFPEPDQAPLLAQFIKRWKSNDKKAYMAATRALLGWDVTARLGELTQPVLIISADQDYTPVAEKEAYAALIPRSKVMVVEQSRHATPVDQPDRFNQIVLDFLQQSEAS